MFQILAKYDYNRTSQYGDGMRRSYSNEEKITILKFAAANGVVAAGKEYGISRQIIGGWNKKLKIYKPQTAAYPMARRREILNYADTHSIKDAARHFGVSHGTITIWNREMRQYRRKQNAFTDEQKLEILYYARDFGIYRAVDRFDVNPTNIIRWNKRFKVYEPIKFYTTDEIIKILGYAKKNGLTATSQHFNIAKYTLTRWNKKYKVYTKRDDTGHAARSTRQQLEILRYAKQIYDDLPADVRSAHMVFSMIANKMDVSVDQISNWNKKFKIVPVRAIKKRPTTQQEIDEVQKALNTSRGRMAAASRKTGVSEFRISKLKKDKKVAFNMAADKMKTRPPVGKKKTKTITAIISGLLKAKSKE